MELKAEGFSPQKVYKLTGYKEGVDGLMDYFEPIRKKYINEELSKAYDFGNTDINYGIKTNSAGAAYDPSTDSVFAYTKNIGDDGYLLDPSDKTKKYISHELQHAIQEREGFAKGGGVSDFIEKRSIYDNNINYLEGVKTNTILATRKTDKWKEYQSNLDKALKSNNKADIKKWHGARSSLEKSATKDIDDELYGLYEKTKISPYDQYMNLAGEAEARNVEKRLSMSMPERVAKAPWDTRDVLEKDLTVTGLLGKSNSVKMADSDMARGILELYKTEPLTAIKQAKRSGLLDEIGDQMPRPRGDVSNAGELRAKANSDRFADTEYQGQHGAPMAEDNAPLHDLSQVYPSDIYSSKGLQYYGTGNKSIDAESMKAIQSFRGKPDKQITMYRAIPDDIGDVDINAGDWVSLSKQYAKDHGESALNGNYKIISKKAPARQLFTNGDSINEFGFDPSIAK